MSGILQTSGRELATADRLAISLIRKFYMEGYRDKTLAENEILESPVQSVIVRAVGLADLPATGKYVAGKNLAVKPFKRLAYADCAKCLVDAVEDTNWIGKIINVGNAYA